MKLLGTGSALPKKQVTNDDISKFLDTSDEWIFQRTGIKTRHVISSEKLEDLAADAARKALEDAGLQPSDVDYFICSNVVNEYLTPGLSCIISEKLGLTAPCIDINCACPGFLYAMDIAESYFMAGKVDNVLIVCAEEPTRMTSWQDRATCVLFGDGAGAAIFGKGNNLKAIKLHTSPDPDKLRQFRVLQPTPFITKEEEDIPLQMNGREVFKFAVTTCIKDFEEVFDEAGITAADIDHFMIHQANLRIIDAIRERIDTAPDKFRVNITDHGNSSSASCPILLDECRRSGKVKPGDLLAFSSFGAGLLSAAAVLEI